MPKVVITENDKTGSLAPDYLDYTVLVPGVATFTEEYKLYTRLKDFEKDFETIDGNALYAHFCLKIGLPVLYAKVASETAEDIKNCFEHYNDRTLFNIRFVTAGFGLLEAAEDEDAKDITLAMIKLATERGDAFAVCDVRKALEKSSTYIQGFMAGALTDPFPEEIVRKMGEGENAYAYGGLIAPGFKCDESRAIKEDLELPASLGYICAFKNGCKKFPEWYAMAGSQRGVLPFTNVKACAQYGEADIDLLQIRGAAGKSCNLICNIRPFGDIIWGNRTLLPNDENVEIEDEDGEIIGYELKAANFLNVRQLCCKLKKELYRICRKYTFEPNSDVLWSNFSNEITVVLDEMQSGNGIRGYRIEQLPVVKKATLRAKIRIIPIEAVEDFEITVELNDSIEVTE